jgi:hypothetical protein
MGDWVAHPSSTVARKILMIYQLWEGGSPEPPGVRKNKLRTRDIFPAAEPSCCSFLIKFAIPFDFPFSSRRRIFEGICFHPLLYLSLVLTCKHEEEARI